MENIDLISREDALAVVRYSQNAVDGIENLPSVDAVEVKHGEWEFEHNPIDDPKGYFIRIVCSECGLKTGQVSNYCPQCGAKMDGKRDAE